MIYYIEKISNSKFIVKKQTTTQSAISDIFTIFAIATIYAGNIAVSIMVAQTWILDFFTVFITLVIFKAFSIKKYGVKSAEEVLKELQEL